MSQTIVVKIGTSSLTKSDGKLALSTISALVETLTNLRESGHKIVLVTSGAVGVGCARLKLTERPKKIALKQAVAAVGQGRLMRIYDDLFSNLGQAIAQVLLTRNNFAERSSYLNAENTFKELLNLDVIPVVNENDTVAVDELKFGDNDSLSALVASLIGADRLFLLTDVDTLYTADPRQNPEAKPITVVNNMDEISNLQFGDRGTQWGTGGMITKINAAKIATTSGVETIITNGQYPENIKKILEGAEIGTKFIPQPRPENARKRWIGYGLVPSGKIYLDEGAIAAITQKGKSLLPAGITGIEGKFNEGDSVSLCDREGNEIARGLVKYNSTELQQIKGKHSDQIQQILGYEGEETVVHRDDMMLIN
jgi:glutamate 5-kinase